MNGASTSLSAHLQVNGASKNHLTADDGKTAAAPPQPLPPPSSVSAPVTTQPSRVDARVSGANQAQMKVEEGHDVKPTETVSLSQDASALDSSRHPDALSSPGSTAPSMLTPAVHDASANTSPDSEAAQYTELNDETVGGKQQGGDKVGEGKGSGEGKITSSTTAPASDASLPTPISGVEEQLLQESAAAQLSQPAGSSVDASSLRGASEDNALTAASGAVVEHGTQSRRSLLDNQHPAQPPSDAQTSENSEHKQPGGAPVPMEIDEPETATSIQQPPEVSARNGRTVQGGTDKVKAEPEAELHTSSIPAVLEQSLGPTSSSQANRGSQLTQRDTDMSRRPSGSLKSRDRRRQSVPTVIFGKQPKKSKPPEEDGTVVVSEQRGGRIPSDDYFTPLFIEGFTRQSSWMKPIEKLINQAHKTISTSDQYISMLDHQACKILRRVYHLQQHDKWSLRQPVRCPEPTRQRSHWDVLLQEAKWMRTDFRQEGKWKRMAARNLAYACAEWVNSSPATRLELQVNAVIPPRRVASQVDGPKEAVFEPLEDPPDLIHTDSPTEHEDELPDVLIQSISPSAIFGLPYDEVVFQLQPSKTADLLLDNLPMYGSPLAIPKFDVADTEHDPDATWKRPAVPLSKYVEGEMVLAGKKPPRKRRRYDYLDEDDEDDEIDGVIFEDGLDNEAELQAKSSAVALFNSDMKGIRDRLHAGHQFRPPTEHPMPPQNFFESRTASQWTWAEDEQLKVLVRECSYNWSLIAAMASTTSAFASGAERRTPWECFERWVSLGSLDGLPNDMARTPYFKAYQARIDAAQRVIAQQNQNAQQQQQVGPNGAVAPVPRRRPTTSIRVERRRNQKHLALIDAMRKLAKKREATAQKAQQAANLAAMRKANEVPRQQIQNKTPRDYSIMRWERDQALAERMAAYAIRQADANARRLVSTLSAQGIEPTFTKHCVAYRNRTTLARPQAHLVPSPQVRPPHSNSLQQTRSTTRPVATQPVRLRWLDRARTPDESRSPRRPAQSLPPSKPGWQLLVALFRLFRWLVSHRLSSRQCKLHNNIDFPWPIHKRTSASCSKPGPSTTNSGLSSNYTNNKMDIRHNRGRNNSSNSNRPSHKLNPSSSSSSSPSNLSSSPSRHHTILNKRINNSNSSSNNNHLIPNHKQRNRNRYILTSRLNNILKPMEPKAHPRQCAM